MRENSRVPPTRRSSGSGGRPTDMALGEPPVPGESVPGEAEPGAEVSSAQRDEASPPSELPRRVRGSNGMRPPARVERPVIPEAVLERLRAAAESEAQEAAEEQPIADVAAQAVQSAEVRRQSPSRGGAEPEEGGDSAERSSPKTSPSNAGKAPSSPRRVFGKGAAARKPPTHARSSFSNDTLKDQVEAIGETTQPIPAIRSLDTGPTKSAAPTAAAETAPVPQQDRTSSARKTAGTGNPPSTQLGGDVLERPGSAGPRSVGRPATPAQRAASRRDAWPGKGAHRTQLPLVRSVGSCSSPRDRDRLVRGLAASWAWPAQGSRAVGRSSASDP